MKPSRSLIALLLLSASTVAIAQSTSPETLTVSQVVYEWSTLLSTVAGQTLARPGFQLFADACFVTLAVIAFLPLIRQSINRQTDTIAWINMAIFVAAVRAGMSGYDVITSTVYGASYNIQSIYATGLLGYDPRNGSWDELLQIMTHSTIESISLFRASIMQLFVSMAYFLVFCLLGLCALIAAVYAQWGYLIAKLTGLLFVPFILVPEVRHYFTNWLALFLSVCVFNIVVGILMPMLLLSTKLALGIPHLVEFDGAPVSLAVDDGFSTIALLCFIVIGMFYLFRAFAIAGALVGGQGAFSVRLMPAMRIVG